MVKEIWKSTQGFKVSNKGSVKNNSNRELSLELTRNGYLRVTKNNKHYLVHRLVAQAFIPNPDNLPCVNHKNEDRTDNRVENLEWCTYSYNINYGSRNSKMSKKVNQLTLEGELVKVFDSIREASRYTGIPAPNILNCCKGNLNKTHGFKWCYA